MFDRHTFRLVRLVVIFVTDDSQTQAPPTQAERDGLQEMVDAIGAAFQRAKARGKEDKVYHYMDLPSNRRTMMPMVRTLQKKDEAFQPGTWFEKSLFFKIKNQSTFKGLIERAEAHDPTFKWESWKEL